MSFLMIIDRNYAMHAPSDRQSGQSRHKNDYMQQQSISLKHTPLHRAFIGTRVGCPSIDCLRWLFIEFKYKPIYL
jgi:hypothetical protein